MGIVTNDVKRSLKTDGEAGKEVGVVCHAHHSDSVGANLETKFGVVQRHEAGVHIDLEVATGPDMSLPVAFVLLDLSADLVLQLYMAVSVLISEPAVVQDISTFTIVVQLSNLDASFN